MKYMLRYIQAILLLLGSILIARSFIGVSDYSTWRQTWLQEKGYSASIKITEDKGSYYWYNVGQYIEEIEQNERRDETRRFPDKLYKEYQVGHEEHKKKILIGFLGMAVIFLFRLGKFSKKFFKKIPQIMRLWQVPILLLLVFGRTMMNSPTGTTLWFLAIFIALVAVLRTTFAVNKESRENEENGLVEL